MTEARHGVAQTFGRDAPETILGHENASHDLHVVHTFYGAPRPVVRLMYAAGFSGRSTARGDICGASYSIRRVVSANRRSYATWRRSARVKGCARSSSIWMRKAIRPNICSARGRATSILPWPVSSKRR
ncbi:hypothetical protein BCAR13_480013 [Paraburkholderia caribensis]|nr:hypothetical protein BCAR13_480013 [Paraburkholderia caribensis]